MMYYNSDYYSPMSHSFHSFLGPIVMVAFWVLVIWAILRFMKGCGHHGRHGHNHAMEILKERYAKGEITREQFESIKKDIS